MQSGRLFRGLFQALSKRPEGKGANGAKIRNLPEFELADAERSPSSKGRCWSTCGRTHAVNGKPFTCVKTREITKIAIGIGGENYWSAPRRRNRVRARRADGRVAGASGTDARGLTAARLTLRGTSHTRTRAEPDTTGRGSKEHCHAVTH
ncbi:hypothetical protein EVAR_98586_1 [Eumeta japonica]|uniref:Uncharacterized protein n=1 Tax=Eumeta variegata TaxID=151549 RepID=A0A4C1T370_EUMVA|nr:hypothetical protein EVAR_98586_1 [Eumeta japonica]